MNTREAMSESKPPPGDQGQATCCTTGYVLLLCGVAAVCVEGVGLYHGAYPIGAGVWAGLVACVSGVSSLHTKDGKVAMVLVLLNTITGISLVFSSSFILAHSKHQFEGVWWGGLVRNLYLSIGLFCYSILLLLGLAILGVTVLQIWPMRGRGEKSIGHLQSWQYSTLGAENIDV